MTRRDILSCVHEPFGDAFYFGPERLSSRYENDEEAREQSGFGNSTFKTIFDRIERESKEVRSNSTSSILWPCFTIRFPHFQFLGYAKLQLIHMHGGISNASTA